METDWDDLFTVDEIMGGLPARRASALLFAIEGHTAYIVARSRRALTRDYSGRSAEQEEQAFLSALSGGASLPLAPTIQDLERYAPEWSPLVPPDPSVRAALARLIGEKYRVSTGYSPQLQRALGIYSPEVANRFRELHNEPISSIFVTDLTLRERLRSQRSRLAAQLESLPPFWVAFALTLTETAGGGALALPIAFAELGVAGAIGVLFVLGFVNVLTINSLAESMARNGEVRYGRAYFGKVVEDFLGRTGRLILTISVMTQMIIALIAYVIGISTTLTRAFGSSPMVWTLGFTVFLLFFLVKGSIQSTVSSALVIGMCTIGSLIIISLLAARHLNVTYLRHNEIPFVDGNPLDVGVLQLIFGVALMSLTGHSTIAASASIVLPRDTSARSLILGSSAGIAFAAMLYMLWIVTVNGAVDPVILANQTGTALEPLADVAGPAVMVFGTIFVLLAMGLASIYRSWGLANLVREWTSSSMLTSATPKSRTRKYGLIGMLPTILVFLSVEALFATDTDSFAKPIAIAGVINIPLMAGIFPMLMLYAARRKGDRVPAYLWSYLGNRFVVAGLICFFLTSLVVHGLLVLENPALRALAIGVSVGIAIFIVYTRRTAFFPRGTLEILYDEHEGVGEPAVSLVAAGQVVTPIEIREVDSKPSSIRDASWRPPIEVSVPAMPITALRVWVHALIAEGISIPLNGAVAADGREESCIDVTTGRTMIPMAEEPVKVVVHPVHDPKLRSS